MKKEAFRDLFGFLKTKLEDKVKDVKPSTHLRDSVACLSGDSPRHERLHGKDPEGRRARRRRRSSGSWNSTWNIRWWSKIREIVRAGTRIPPLLGDLSLLIFDMAVIAEGGKPENPSRFGKMIGDLMATALDA